jgi:hypothetical protein
VCTCACTLTRFAQFSDKLLYAKAKAIGRGFVYLDDVSTNMILVSQMPNAKKDSSFLLIRLDQKKKKYEMLCRTVDQRNEWMAAFQKLIDNALPVQVKRAPVSAAMQLRKEMVRVLVEMRALLNNTPMDMDAFVSHARELVEKAKRVNEVALDANVRKAIIECVKSVLVASIKVRNREANRNELVQPMIALTKCLADNIR